MSESDGTIIQFLNGSHSFDGIWFSEKHPLKQGAFWWRNALDDHNDKHQKLIEIVSAANQMLNCLLTKQEIKLWKHRRKDGTLSSWKQQALAQIELFQKLNKEID